eukprot:5036288-Pleurochrysis_carterae.AAC.2
MSKTFLSALPAAVSTHSHLCFAEAPFVTPLHFSDTYFAVDRGQNDSYREVHERYQPRWELTWKEAIINVSGRQHYYLGLHVVPFAAFVVQPTLVLLPSCRQPFLLIISLPLLTA